MTEAGCVGGGEEAFNAAKAVFSLYGGLFSGVVREYGLEKALALHAKQAEAFDAVLADLLRKRLDGKRLDLEMFASARSEALRILGIAAQADGGPGSLKVLVGACPLYEGLRAAGLTHGVVEAMCRRGVDLGYARLAEAFLGLSGSLQFRSGPDQPCVEEFTLSRESG
jgi:hypothetical protein